MFYRKGMPDRAGLSVIKLFLGSLVVPSILDFIMLDARIVVMLLIPFHLAATISYLGEID